VHWQVDVTTPADSPSFPSGDESRRDDRALTTAALQTALYTALNAQAADLATRWRAQSRRILLVDSPPSDEIAPPDTNVAVDLVSALLAAFAFGDEESEAAAVATGLQFGADSFTHGASLHHTIKAVDVLIAMVMHATEKAASDNKASRGSAADGVWLARQLQSRAGILSLAVIRGYTQAQGDALRDRFRHLRHDLRNPLGTIKSVLALMDDESIPTEARANANFRAMAKRNARSLEEMISDRLADTTVPLRGMVDRDISVQAVAESVRRGLRREAEQRGVTILIDSTEMRGRFDVPGLELLLQAVLEAALQGSHTGEQIHLTFDENGESRVTVSLSHRSNHAPIERRNALDRLTTLARRIGASLSFADPITISLPMHDGEQGARAASEPPVRSDTIVSGVAETPQNLRSTREDDHGQANVL
jgi:signal transduction histidine kinase